MGENDAPRRGRGAGATGRGQPEAGPGAEPQAGPAPVALDATPLPPPLRDQIAAQGREESLTAEIGSLRAVLARLLATAGDDPAQLSQSVPRVVNAIVRALRAQRLLAGEPAGDLNEMVARIMARMDGTGDE